MSQPARPAAQTDKSEPDLARELAAIAYEPLLPVEKKLIAWSLVLGVVLLGLLLWASATLFPVTARGPASARVARRLMHRGRPASRSKRTTPRPLVAVPRGQRSLLTTRGMRARLWA